MNDEAKPNPMLAAQTNMRGPLIKRFYRTASVEKTKGGWALKLDGRLAHTPGRAPLVAPTRAIAELIAAEWNAQCEVIDPRTMPATRLANSAIDGVARAMEETRAQIARYAGSDLICYRASEPEVLRKRQAAEFDPVLAWAEREFSARFVLVEGVTYVAQPEEALQRVKAVLATYCDDPFSLAALHVLTSLSGSALIALAVAFGALSAEAGWAAAHVDEDFQISKWGEDFEAAERRAARWREFEAAAPVVRALSERKRCF